MKLSKLFFGVAAAAMFAACSSDELVQEQAQPQWNADGTGYMAFSVAMPQPPSSRSSENDQFADGLASEFEVKDMILVLFQAPVASPDPEAEATFVSAYNVLDQNEFGMVGTSTDNVTSDRLIVQKIVKPTSAGNIYAFVVLNNNGLFAVDDDHHTMKVNSVDFTGNIHDLQIKTLTGINNNADNTFRKAGKGFLMMNAPLFTSAGGSTEPTGALQVLSPVNSTNIKKTKNEAQGAPAANVYVERAVAKVTMNNASGTHTATAPYQTGFGFTLDSWKLDNTNKKSYLVRNTDDFNSWTALHSAGTTSTKQYRFVGHEASVAHTGSLLDGADGTDALYRTYFAKDPNYTGTPADYSLEFNTDASATGLSNLFGAENPQYCAENTFDVTNQTWKNTTRVIVKATLSKVLGGTLYGRPGDDGFFTETAIQTLAFNKVLEQLEAEPTFGTAISSGTATFANATFDISSTIDNVNVKIGGLTYTTDTDGDALKAKYTTYGVDLNAASLGSNIHYYAGGTAYYQARIKHFGDDLTPWNTWEDGTTNTKPTATTAYPNNSGPGNTQNDKYLGRWGMLRNNWYELSLGTIKKIGEYDPAKLTLDNTTDDELEEWISVDVNILSWAKRPQTIDF